MPAKTIPDEEFIEVWNQAKNIQQVADHFNVSHNSVWSRAKRLRKKYGLRDKRRK